MGHAAPISLGCWLFSAGPVTSTLAWSVRGLAGCCLFSRGHRWVAAGPGRSITGWSRIQRQDPEFEVLDRIDYVDHPKLG